MANIHLPVAQTWITSLC